MSWYLFCANDVEFFPGQLSALNRQFWVKSGLLAETSAFPRRDTDGGGHPVPDHVDIAYFNWKNMNSGGYNLFIMKRSVFNLIGMFDENMYPAFFEDADMDRRVELCRRMSDKR